MDVAVLMSTYNGEMYLREQIDSILNQNGVRVTLYIRDDGSSDGTISILREYENAGKIKLIDSPEKLGPGASFMELLYTTQGHMYYAFADQDDIWKTDKLITGVRAIIKKSDGIPCLYCSNQMLYEDGKETHIRFNSPPPHTLVSCICGNYLSGCTMVFNKELRDIVAHGKVNRALIKIRLHDAWVINVALVCGNVIYDHHSYIDYRIHSNNTVGLKKGRLKRIIQKFKNNDSRNGRSKLCQELLKLIPINDAEKKKTIQCFAECNKGFKNKMRLIKNQSIKESCKENRILFFLKTLVGWQ